MISERCPWYRISSLVWETGCDHQIGTPRSWEPKEDSPCMCCKKPVVIVEDISENVQVSLPAL